ncbi:hypothetical protein SAMN05518670_4006 [Paenibacillus sp. OK076]|nr:hypothetical protein SAMN05518670_4006 [Paenibacillus sp. OK076]
MFFQAALSLSGFRHSARLGLPSLKQLKAYGASTTASIRVEIFKFVVSGIIFTVADDISNAYTRI